MTSKASVSHTPGLFLVGTFGEQNLPRSITKNWIIEGQDHSRMQKITLDIQRNVWHGVKACYSLCIQIEDRRFKQSQWIYMIPEFWTTRNGFQFIILTNNEYSNKYNEDSALMERMYALKLILGPVALPNVEWRELHTTQWDCRHSAHGAF